MQLPNPPWYRRWSVILAGIIVLAALTALLGWRGLQQAADPATANPTVPSTTAPEPATTQSPTTRPPDTTGATPGVLWERKGSETERSRLFRAPPSWRIVWSFDCSSFARYGGGNFKLSGQGAFERVLIQEFDVKANGTRSVTGGGFGRLFITSVCERWTVQAFPA
jgi:hypothetical protein